jgi:hypothetical protein
MYARRTLSASDVAAYAGFWSWFQPSHEARLAAITSRAMTYDDQCAIDSEIYARKRVAAIEAFDTTPEIKAHMLANARVRGSQNPERVDYTAFLAGALAKSRSPFGKALEPYKPEPGASGIKLKPAEGVRLSYTQESYSDNSSVAVPFEVIPGKPADFEAFTRNVSALVRRADSHNGMAGSGCNYSVSLYGGFVVIHCRASIAD